MTNGQQDKDVQRYLTGPGENWLPRTRHAGALTLNLFHRDVCVAGRWAGLHPREFALLWRLAETPRTFVSRQQLLAEVWRLDHDPETNRVEVNISRIRAKLHVFNLSWLVITGDKGGYALDSDVIVADRPPLPLSGQDTDDSRALGSYLPRDTSDRAPTESDDDHAISEKRPSID